MPLTDDMVNSQKGKLFEHAVILELIRRLRTLKKDYKLCFWRTSGGAEVDCIIDMGQKVIPIEVKASKRILLSEIKGLSIFLDEYKEVADKGYVVTMGRKPEKLTEKITAVPWNYL
jgi:predicted AAA+ superfamily ATPase